MASGAYNRTKGHAYERRVSKELRKFFPKAVTARAGARFEDSKGIDIINTGDFNIQTKARENLNIFNVIFREIQLKDGINLLFWKKNREKDLVIMKKEDFYKILKNLLL